MESLQRRFISPVAPKLSLRSCQELVRRLLDHRLDHLPIHRLSFKSGGPLDQRDELSCLPLRLLALEPVIGREIFENWLKIRRGRLLGGGRSGESKGRLKEREEQNPMVRFHEEAY